MSAASADALLDIRDGVAVAKHLAAALVMACSSPGLSGEDRSALATFANFVRERLEDALSALDALIGVGRG